MSAKRKTKLTSNGWLTKHRTSKTTYTMMSWKLREDYGGYYVSGSFCPPLEHDPHVGIELRDGGEARISIVAPGWTGPIVTTVRQPEAGREEKLMRFAHALAYACWEANKERAKT